jgi:hypothetical protein
MCQTRRIHLVTGLTDPTERLLETSHTRDVIWEQILLTQLVSSTAKTVQMWPASKFSGTQDVSFQNIGLDSFLSHILRGLPQSFRTKVGTVAICSFQMLFNTPFTSHHVLYIFAQMHNCTCYFLCIFCNRCTVITIDCSAVATVRKKISV